MKPEHSYPERQKIVQVWEAEFEVWKCTQMEVMEDSGLEAEDQVLVTNAAAIIPSFSPRGAGTGSKEPKKSKKAEKEDDPADAEYVWSSLTKNERESLLVIHRALRRENRWENRGPNKGRVTFKGVLKCELDMQRWVNRDEPTMEGGEER
jgi:hypothetical protein